MSARLRMTTMPHRPGVGDAAEGREETDEREQTRVLERIRHRFVS
jgi:hypothetical protein